MPDRLIAIDPSLRATGYAILETDGRRHTALGYGVVRNAAALKQSTCLLAIHERITDLIREWQPSAMAIEGVIYAQSYKTAITLGAARGAAILAAARQGLPVHEYAPKRVKQAVVGLGSAQKDQVAFMVRAALRLTENPPSDAADALAIGLTHIQTAQTAARRPLAHESL
jgi:crossover junction endodeoxyribonuclease RuvC